VRAIAPRRGENTVSGFGRVTKHQARHLILVHASVEQMSFAVLTIPQ